MGRGRPINRETRVIRNLAEKIRSLDEPPDVTRIAGAVSELLDRSVGAEEYLIRAAAEGAEDEADGRIDLNSIDFDALAAKLAGRKRSAAQRIANQLGQQLEASARRNPGRLDLVARLRDLIDEYNAGSLNVDDMLRRLQALSRDLSDDEERTVREGLNEQELAIFDLLTKPDPTLTDRERDEVKRIARKLLESITDRLVLDWRRKAATRDAARVLVNDVLDELPDAYDPEVWQRKTDAVFNHIFASYYDDGHSVYDELPAEPSQTTGTVAIAEPVVVERVTRSVLEQIRMDPTFAQAVAEQLKGTQASFAVPVADLIRREEAFNVEFKATARWNLRENIKDPRMEDAVVKTVAGFLNADGGTLLIGVMDEGTPIGLTHDLELVKPQNVDGLINWLTTHLIRALRHTPAARAYAHIEEVAGIQICRVDVAASSQPVTATMSDGTEKFWVRMNNSTRALPEVEIEDYCRDHWR